MKKKWLSLLLALAMCLALLPAAASEAETNLPDWYFLFAIFKNVDADCNDRDGKPTHAKYSMTQDEIDFIREEARDFEEYMNQVGVMRAHVDVVEIDTTVKELAVYSGGGSWLTAELAYPFLKDNVNLDKYDHVFCVTSLNVRTSYLGLTGSPFENGSGHSCINLVNWEFCLNSLGVTEKLFVSGFYVHEFLHFMNQLSKKWGMEFGLHDIRINFYSPDHDDGRECYTDIILNRAKGNAGTGVAPIAWQYPPHMVRTITELTLPSGTASVGTGAFLNSATLTKVTIPGSVASIEYGAFRNCANLTDVTMFSGLTSVGKWVFANSSALTRVTIPASVTSIDYAAFWGTNIKDIYYEGTEAQWKKIQIGDYNGALTKANIHYNHLLADVKTTAWYAGPVAWALEKSVTAGTGGGRFSPDDTCTQAQILTFLWRANGSPAPSGKVSGTQYYAAAVQWAKEQGVTSGTLSPNAPCTRADAVTYLWRLAGSPDAKAASFTDVPDNASYAKAVSWAVEQGVTSGVSADRFAPGAACTRAQIAAFLYRALAQ